MNIKKEKPSIRFKGFTEAWEQCELGSFYNFAKGKGLSLDSFYEGKSSLAIAYGHLYTKYSEVIRNVSLSSYDDSGVLSQSGDILFPGSSTVPFGTAQANAIMLDNVKLGGDVIIARSKGIVHHAPFISYQINAKKEKLYPITVGTTITHMYGKDISNIEYFFPKIEEQTKIGNLLESIDSLITLHQRKYDKLVNVKKSLLEQMFPQKNEKTPKIRFKGFTDAWEQYKLGQLIIETIDNRGKNPPYYCKSGIPIIDNFMIKNSGYPDLAIATRYLDENLYCNFIRKYNEVNDVLITLVGNGIGNIALFPKQKSVIIQNTIGMRFEDNKIFKYYSLLSKYRTIMMLDRGMAQPSIRQDELKDIDIELPCVDEQDKISSLLFNLDNIITLHQRKYEKLLNFKKALLEKMFI